MDEQRLRPTRRRLRTIKALIAARRYHYSNTVRDFIEEGDFSEEDLERCILSATEIQKAEEDELGLAIDGQKYTILGADTLGQSFYTRGKIIRNEQEQLYFFITAHEQN